MRVYLEEDEQFGIDIVRDGDDIYYRQKRRIYEVCWFQN